MVLGKTLNKRIFVFSVCFKIHKILSYSLSCHIVKAILEVRVGTLSLFFVYEKTETEKLGIYQAFRNKF